MKYVYLYGGAIGDSLVGIHVARTLEVRKSGTRLLLLSTRRNPFVRELTQSLSFVRYREFIKGDPRTWWVAFSLITSPSCIFVFEPTDVPLPPWWLLILRISTWFPGSREVHSQLIGHEKELRSDIQKIIVTPEDNLFTSNVPRILSAWGVEGETIAPSLPAVSCERSKPYIVFHFFAGSYRRSWPLENVRPLLENARSAFPGHEFVLTASGEEGKRAEEMAEGISNTRIESGRGAASLVQVLSCADMVVGVASGVTHISSHLSKPTVALANLSDPYWLPTYAPKTVILANREECRCKGNKEGDCNEVTPHGSVFRCIYFISTDSVIEAMRKQQSL